MQTAPKPKRRPDRLAIVVWAAVVVGTLAFWTSAVLLARAALEGWGR